MNLALQAPAPNQRLPSSSTPKAGEHVQVPHLVGIKPRSEPLYSASHSGALPITVSELSPPAGVLHCMSIRSRLTSLPLSTPSRIHGDRLGAVAMDLRRITTTSIQVSKILAPIEPPAFVERRHGPFSRPPRLWLTSLRQLFVVRVVYSTMPASISLFTLPLTIFSSHPLTKPSVVPMPPRQPSSSDPTLSGRGEQRPTLPPIRQIFGRECSASLVRSIVPLTSPFSCFPEELARSVPPHQARQSASPHLNRLQLADEDPQRISRGRSSPVPPGYAPGTPRSFPVYPDPQQQSTPSHHPRGSSDPAVYPPYAQGVSAHPSVQSYPHGYPPQYAQVIHPRTPIPTGSYPYAGAQTVAHPSMGMVGPPGPQHQPYPGSDQAVGDRSSTSRYECSYCGKGFTRPSSLRVRRCAFLLSALRATWRLFFPVVC